MCKRAADLQRSNHLMSDQSGQICYLCGESIEGKSSDDHIPPKQFYPKEIRENKNLNLQLAPSHEQCNNAYKDDEEYFYASLYPLVEKHNPEIAATILRDFARRCKNPQMPAMLRKIFGDASGTSQGGIILPVGVVEINVDLYKIQRIAGKIARGALFLSKEIYIPESNIVDMRICPEESEVPDMYQISWKIAGSIKGPYPKVFSYKYMQYEEYHIISLLFWEAFMFCITIQGADGSNT